MTGADFRALSDEEAMRQIDGIGVLARVSPEDKVHLVDILRQTGHVVAMTGDGVNDAPALKKADIGIAMGITGTEVSKQAAVMILTDDDFGTIVKAVGLGRAVYDNLLRFIRFQMAGLFGFIATFLGSSLLNILGGIPFLPLQTLWLNFSVTTIQAIGLGYGKPREGLMKDPPRPKAQQILPRRLMSWLVFTGLVMAVGTLGVLWWGNDQYGDVVARTLGLTTFSLFRLFSSLENADADESLFGGSILGNRPLLIATGLSVLTIILATELGFLQRLLGTVSLTVDQWLICIGVALSLIVVEEARKLLRLRTGDEPEATTASPVGVAA
jgi:Ca2+-transporting ATPase